MTDASKEGWGAVDVGSGVIAQGRWSLFEKEHSIHYLELLAVFHALRSIYKKCSLIHIGIQSDNVCAMSYINDMGGRHSVELDNLAKNIWFWCLERQLFVSASYVPTAENNADFFSRNFSDSTEWMLKNEIFMRVCKQLFTPDIDLFASRLNARLKTYVSWFPDPDAFQYDAFAISWCKFQPYVFPPFSLVGKVINKIVQNNVERAILIFPLWTSQPWFPVLLENLCSYPVRLPRHKDLLVLPHNGEYHPLIRTLKIFAAEVSGQSSVVKAFREKLQMSSAHLGNQAPESSIPMLGNDGLFGTISGLEIHYVRLRQL